MKKECSECKNPITDKTRSKFCKEHRGPSTHGIKPSIKRFARP